VVASAVSRTNFLMVNGKNPSVITGAKLVQMLGLEHNKSNLV
jgi:hypothetical protein